MWLPDASGGFETWRVAGPPGTDGSFVAHSEALGRKRIAAKEARLALPLNPEHLSRPPPHDLVT